MANSEDYLDGLLESVKTVRSDVKRAEEMAEETRKQREEQRNSRISPNDDFMAASGLHDYVPEPTSHINLRKAFSEEDFLREFEEDLASEETDVDAFIRDFEEEIDREEMVFSQEEEPSFMDSIESIVNQAKEQIEQGEISLELPEEDEAFDDEQVSDSEVFVEEIGIAEDEETTEEDEATESPVEAEEEDDLPALGAYEDELPSLDESGDMLDEDSTDMDLMDLLSGDADLGDIGALLQADDEHLELEEAQDEFELQADAVSTEDEQSEELTEDALAEAQEEGKKSGFISRLLSFFSKKHEDKGGTGPKEVLDISPEENEDISQENLNILKSLDETEQEGDKKEKKRRGKKEKEPKEKKQRTPREKKPKKERVPDVSPKIPGKVIMVFVVLGISMVVLITLGQSALGYRMSLSNARAAYSSGDYFMAYENLMGVTLKEDDQELFKKARLLGDLQKRGREYQVFMAKEKYSLVLDSLVIGVARYDENYDEAKTLGIEEEYKALGESLIQLLSDQFGVSKDDAVALYKLHREDYSIRLDEIIEESNL